MACLRLVISLGESLQAYPQAGRWPDGLPDGMYDGLYVSLCESFNACLAACSRLFIELGKSSNVCAATCLVACKYRSANRLALTP